MIGTEQSRIAVCVDTGLEHGLAFPGLSALKLASAPERMPNILKLDLEAFEAGLTDWMNDIYSLPGPRLVSTAPAEGQGLPAHRAEEADDETTMKLPGEGLQLLIVTPDALPANLLKNEIETIF